MSQSGQQGGHQGGTPYGQVSTIHLDDATRKRILAELGVQADIAWVPASIQVARVNHQAIGQASKLTHPNPWVLVMV
jgi:hypothetical protein